MPLQGDITKIKLDKSAQRGFVGESAVVRWWLAEERDLHERVGAVAKRIHHNLSSRRRQNWANALMYNDIDAGAFYAAQLGQYGRGADYGVSHRISINVVQNAIDTAASMIAKNRPKPLFMADGGEWSQRVRAKKLTRYVAGVFDDAKVYPLGARLFTDAAVYGTGCIKMIADEQLGKIRAEKPQIGEILVDDVDGRDEAPQQLHQRKYVSRDVLLEMYPDSADDILRATSDVRTGNYQQVADMIPVLESWHLKSGPSASDGLHCITIENTVLFVEEYKKAYYPILFWRWYHQTQGFWGRGICQEIGKMQRVMNKTIRTIDLAQDLVGVPVVFMPRGAGLVEDQVFNNEIGRGIDYSGETPPSFATPPACSPELYDWAWALEDRMYKTAGIAQNAASGTKPPELKSGAAIREAADMSSSRFQQVGQTWEEFHTDIADVTVDLSKDLFERRPDLSIASKKGSTFETIKWADVDIERDRYRIQVYEVSALPTSPAGRLEMLQEWAQDGFIPKEMMMSLMNIPDLESFTELETATNDEVEQTIGRIKEEDVYTAGMKPIPQMNLALAVGLATMHIVLAKRQGLPESVLTKIDLYIQDLDQLQKEQTPPAPPPGAPQLPPPGAAPPAPG